MVFLRSRLSDEVAFSEAPGFLNHLQRLGHPKLVESLQSLTDLRSRRRRSAIMAWGSLLVGCALILPALYYGLLGAAKLAVKSLPVSIDRSIGQMASQSVQVGQRLPRDHVAQKFVEQVVERLKPYAALQGLDFQVRVVDDPQPNAFALPGGQMVVYTGLLELARSADQVAGVLAHEMAHATLRHGLMRIGQSMGVIAAVQLLMGDAAGLVALGAQLAQQSVLTSYSRVAEREADLEGARMLHEAGIDPEAMSEFFLLIHQERGDTPKIPTWISTHPGDEDRAESIRRFKATLPPKTYKPMEVDYESIRKQVSRDSDSAQEGDLLEAKESEGES
jgi:predicted Zn-dependent protease